MYEAAARVRRPVCLFAGWSGGEERGGRLAAPPPSTSSRPRPRPDTLSGLHDPSVRTAHTECAQPCVACVEEGIDTEGRGGHTTWRGSVCDADYDRPTAPPPSLCLLDTRYSVVAVQRLHRTAHAVTQPPLPFHAVSPVICGFHDYRCPLDRDHHPWRT